MKKQSAAALSVTIAILLCAAQPVLLPAARPDQAKDLLPVVQKEAPIHVSNVMIKDPKSGEATRIGYARTKDSVSGKKKVMRVARNSGEMF